MNWSELGRKVADFAPVLGAALGGVGAPVGALIASVFGSSNDPDAINAAMVADPQAKTKLIEIQLNHKIEFEKLALGKLQAELGDKQSAREAHKQSKMPAIITCVMTLLAMFYGFGLFFVEFPESNRDMLNYFGGQLIALWFASVVYWTGTTRGSEDKTRLLGK